MSATINLEKEKHFPVLIDELVSIISPLYGGTFIDCTFGQGSCSKKILEYKNNEEYLTMDKIAIACALDYTSFRFSNKWKNDHSNLDKWFNNFLKNDFMESTSPKIL